MLIDCLIICYFTIQDTTILAIVVRVVQKLSSSAKSIKLEKVAIVGPYQRNKYAKYLMNSFQCRQVVQWPRACKVLLLSPCLKLSTCWRLRDKDQPNDTRSMALGVPTSDPHSEVLRRYLDIWAPQK